ncbi:hypothetical protein E2C01_088282 [Portunus trituberculatus]|uniref:Uncharacterized protein n=1 Tax=Portunus trituberculatus TaxID=210409 RepID=A0A5B7J8T1_PORTR|nr:hypothetical protein [Portunus trituberculatus]
MTRRKEDGDIGYEGMKNEEEEERRKKETTDGNMKEEETVGIVNTVTVTPAIIRLKDPTRVVKTGQ